MGWEIEAIVTNIVVIKHLRYEAFSSQMLLIRKKTSSKESWSHGQLKAAFAAVSSGR
jgi:hypothetical protein